MAMIELRKDTLRIEVDALGMGRVQIGVVDLSNLVNGIELKTEVGNQATRATLTLIPNKVDLIAEAFISLDVPSNLLREIAAAIDERKHT